VFQLLLPLYDPDAGAITLDGVELEKADPKAVRRRIALVPQTGDLRGERRRERALRPPAGGATARCAPPARRPTHRIYRAFPKSMNSFLGERGCAFSGGQRQLTVDRAGAARRPRGAAPRRGDELASDAESESYVQKALEHLMRGRHHVVVAHRSPR